MNKQQVELNGITMEKLNGLFIRRSAVVQKIEKVDCWMQGHEGEETVEVCFVRESCNFRMPDLRESFLQEFLLDELRHQLRSLEQQIGEQFCNLRSINGMSASISISAIGNP